MKEYAIMTYPGCFGHIAQIFLDRRKNKYREVATTLVNPELWQLTLPLPQSRVIMFRSKLIGKDDPTISCGKKKSFYGVVTTLFGRRELTEFLYATVTSHLYL